ncbi:DsrE family protein [Aliarcobacter cryaerophilus]|uniref:DsrE family protein n=1 Tax=Aliarcobacter cryaerophilus TaxID=28198 RepID=UPI0013FDF405|nr:DsrE family protein [Aliarcobacter cryaerophilus]
MIKEILELGVCIKACGTSLKRSGAYKNEPYLNDDTRGSLDLLGEWTINAKRVLTY